jgi:diaminopimelate decarboxylase
VDAALGAGLGIGVSENLGTITGWDVATTYFGAHDIDLFVGFGDPDFDAANWSSADDLFGFAFEGVDIGLAVMDSTTPEQIRSLVGNAGVLLTEVMFLKPGEQKNFCVVDAAMNDLMRPALYEAYMGIVNTHQREGTAETWDVVGPVCESGDWLGRDRALTVQSGDVLAVLSAGAYGMTMSSNYNTRGRAAEIMVDGSQSWVIRERETPADLFRHEHLLPR